MNIQLFGTKKCFDTKKAERYFKERNIKYQFIDLTIKGLSNGELLSVKNCVGINNLINTKSKDYKKLNLDQIRGEECKIDILLKNQQIVITPIVRNGKQATVGYVPEIWTTWE